MQETITIRNGPPTGASHRAAVVLACVFSGSVRVAGPGIPVTGELMVGRSVLEP
ncbi:MAG: hypothetical protein FJ098_15285, partial [Deltaproteobacteria bacterium]|nr:hypothetical protein [Deltaproteobacteria bacterium]